jgi:hypothetical protein
MAKRKPVEAIVLDETLTAVNMVQAPVCYGTKESYCRRELCGDWFEKCVNSVKEGSNDDTGSGD